MKRIIVAEDEPFLARMLKTALVRCGYRVQTVTDGDQAWKLLASDPPDAFVTAASLPGIDGVSLCRRVRRDLSQRDFPIILMTSRADEEVRRNAGQFKKAVVIDKPVSIRSLLSVLDGFFAGDSLVDTLVGEDRVR